MDYLDEMIRCQNCGNANRLDDFGIAGACPGNVFCPDCECEVEIDSGRVALLCGKCDACQSLMVDGTWAEAQTDRMWKRNSR